MDAQLSASGLSSTVDDVVRRTLRSSLRKTRRRTGPVSPDPAQRSESELIDRLKLGDPAAADEFFDRYAARILRFIASALGPSNPAADADDILQDTMIALAEALPFFRGESSLFTFACAIAHRKVLSAFRTNARRSRLTLAVSRVQLDSFEPSSTDNSDVQRAFAQLTPEYREILT